MQIYCKSCKKYTSNTFPKNILISKNKTKGNSKCTICFINRTFIHKTEDEYDVESELEVYLQLFTD